MATQFWYRPITTRGACYIVGGLLAAWTFLAVVALPGTVDAVAYLAGAGGQGTFTATHVGMSCSYSSVYICTPYTDGYLDPGHVPASLPGELYGSFPVRTPAWNWGFEKASVYDGTGDAVIEGLLFCGGTDLGLVGAVLYVAYRGHRAWRSAKSGRAGDAPVTGAA